ncbi:helix-turn-helix domain-containing protein [Celeribacter sp. PS-C1]|uniref:helix-turn-helix domain-containing protein n=1 Tax=Celeribacter sp. PS-C1 TaxID=2820813 RepID=UPI001C683494|nr:helix-turn-helix domain-containing protein [Celeribacter sp. PS-C1]MBW6419642.1 helix-turn-helix domain-containing protein [Celeribacter sp. PS-C1]
MLTTADVAHHLALTSTTVRRKIRDGEILATRVRRDYRVTWENVWACEHGPMPKRGIQERYKAPLLTKKHLASATAYNLRTIERWIEEGLPTRNVFGSVRINPFDAQDWLRNMKGFVIETLDRGEA